MMDTVLGFSVHMDFEGQKLAERLFQIIVVTFGAVGWLYGYYVQDFFMTVLTLGAGFVLACLVTLPPWPVYRRYPLKWAPPQDAASASTSGAENTSGKKKKK
ncbi:signal peptidase complex subunit 1-like [Homarus americanus]|uniref:Signal peptidase complex subunit 1 n=1 Tax=Homarus americanus TaxID=6706 RepID=A0A8J5N204_HOMAM|nr:signal peptidase complex subunit 1-like [Homarus americanus]KAG7171726.1 Signal peptidase complex subunit 1-like [Homarus americanus]